MTMSAPLESTGITRPSVRVASRKLAGLEHAMRLTDDVTPFNVVAVLQLAGDLPVPRLREALDELQRRHPFLRARILPAGKNYFYHFDVVSPIPLEAGERSGPESWIAAAQDALHRPFDLTTGPLVRCSYLHGQSGGDLIITVHHTIIDAASASHLFGELLSRCAGRALSDAGDTAQEGQRPAIALFPVEYTGLRFVRAAAAFMGRQMADEMKFRWRSRGVRKPPIAATGRCCILPIRFSPALTAALIQASRRQRVTLNAILSAGLVAAVQRRLYPAARAPLRHIIFGDLRPRLRSVVPDSALGCLLTMFRFTVMVEKEGSFWALARDIQDSTQRAARSGERYVSYAMSPGMMKMILGLKAFRMGATALSYSGPTNLSLSYGSFEVIGLHAFAANMTLGPEYSALVRLFRGELWWDILYLDSDMDAAGAQAIAREMQTILEEATC
jgi:Condensation domain